MRRGDAASYDLALARARAAHRARATRALESLGPPPYADARTWILKQRWSFDTDPEFVAWTKMAPALMLSAPGYSIRDIYHSISALSFLPARLFEETMKCDATWLGTRLEIPFFLFQGDSDQQAPAKELALLRGGGHMALLLQSDQFLSELVTRVRPLLLGRSVPETE
jgi:hypothetical protein